MTTKTIEEEAREYTQNMSDFESHISGSISQYSERDESMSIAAFVAGYNACEEKLAKGDGARAFSEFDLSSHVLKPGQIVAFGEGAPRESIRVGQLVQLMAWIKQQRSGMKHLLENYIDPNSTAGEAIILSLERLEEILSEEK